MDEFFDFEGAGINGATAIDGRMYFSNGIQQHTVPNAYDIDLILAEAANDGFSFNKYPQFEGNYLQPPGFNAVPMDDSTMSYAENFNDYSRLMNGAVQPQIPCSHCQHNHLHCSLLRHPGFGNTGACTSCISLSLQCSFLYSAAKEPQFMATPASNFQSHTDIEMADARPTQMQTPRSGSSKSPSFRESSHENSESSTKVSGARFSRDTVRLLRHWLQVHHVHPYPTEEEKEDLKRRTGLTKVQITNWLANARRRGQVKPPRASSPSPYNRARPMAIPNQTAKSFENLPLERWKNSPPEHEPASVAAIAKAVDSSPTRISTQTSPDSYPRSEGSAHSGAHGSSASSRSTTHSSVNSIGSVASHHSRGSFGSFGKRGRRRRRHTAKPVPNLTNGPIRQYQCTFCTESFKTKHDWQRHEKSLHLSLERWVCAPSKNKNAVNMKKCVFCGLQNPTEKHYETHNHATCSERPLEERTFYRKDHLRQHLRLVHDCQFLASTMDSWKIAAPEVRSRCGFCGIVMDTWSARVDHLAEHFKAGRTMEEWKGGWGFDSSVMKLVENGMPPCRSIPTTRPAYAALTDIRRSYPLPEDGRIISE